jgi:hypothetical protein
MFPNFCRRPTAWRWSSIHQDQGGQAAQARGPTGRGDRRRRGAVIADPRTFSTQAARLLVALAAPRRCRSWA